MESMSEVFGPAIDHTPYDIWTLLAAFALGVLCCVIFFLLARYQ